MGSGIELNDTLQITSAQGFPADILDLEKHIASPIKLDDVKDKVFQFSGKSGPRIFQLDPVRVYLVHNLNGKWLFWGHIFVQSQSITKSSGDGAPVAWQTSGTFKIVDIYEPEYQKAFTKRESPPGLSYF